MIPAPTSMSTHCLHLSIECGLFAVAKIVINSKQTELIYFVFPSLPIDDFNSLSHKEVFYRFQQIGERMAKGLFQLPNQHFSEVGPANRASYHST